MNSFLTIFCLISRDAGQRAPPGCDRTSTTTPIQLYVLPRLCALMGSLYPFLCLYFNTVCPKTLTDLHHTSLVQMSSTPGHGYQSIISCRFLLGVSCRARVRLAPPQSPVCVVGGGWPNTPLNAVPQHSRTQANSF